jgi:hypothetical protein
MPNIDRTAEILGRLSELDKEIYNIRQKYGIETIGPAPKSVWSALFQRPKAIDVRRSESYLIARCEGRSATSCAGS